MRIYFCCGGCKSDFNKDPEKYIGEMRKAGVEPEKIAPAKAEDKAPEVENDYYTCSMHPQIKQDKPGKCPICGMDLILKKAEKPAKK
jgi:YHS domain-containing protein